MDAFVRLLPQQTPGGKNKQRNHPKGDGDRFTTDRGKRYTENSASKNQTADLLNAIVRYTRTE